MKGYVQLRRGILDHLKIMSFSELKVYIGLLLLASFKTGYVNITIANLCDILGTDYKNTLNSIHRLDKFGYVKYTPAVNQWKNSKFAIIKYNAYVNTTEPVPEAVPEPVPEARPEANVVTPNVSNVLQPPNKVEEGIRRYNKTTNVVTTYFCQIYKQVVGDPYPLNYGKDGAHGLYLEKTFGLEKSKALINKAVELYQEGKHHIFSKMLTLGAVRGCLSELQIALKKQTGKSAVRQLLEKGAENDKTRTVART